MRKGPIRSVKQAASALLSAVASILSSQFTWLILFALSGATGVSGGVYLLYGVGWSLIAAGTFSMLFSTVIFRGIANG
ncbi:MAG: hypothetical protein CMK74_12135 [Pseudomonadales bacterium]|nr:hypothetical protein [Pseudomonadales bacterium]|tara:strand:- start:1585 stop:1818 length:234 start_codon:yes stop_codon:yes gene_type:complete